MDPVQGEINALCDVAQRDRVDCVGLILLCVLRQCEQCGDGAIELLRQFNKQWVVLTLIEHVDGVVVCCCHGDGQTAGYLR